MPRCAALIGRRRQKLGGLADRGAHLAAPFAKRVCSRAANPGALVSYLAEHRWPQAHSGDASNGTNERIAARWLSYIAWHSRLARARSASVPDAMRAGHVAAALADGSAEP